MSIPVTTPLSPDDRRAVWLMVLSIWGALFLFGAWIEEAAQISARESTRRIHTVHGGRR